MSRREPPPIALWMLEHMTAGHRDEALAGDLLEVFRAGQSSSWYWRQAIGACALTWFEGLRTRSSLLMFVLLWSMISPAWNSLCIAIERSSPDMSQAFSAFGPMWLILALILWTILHSFFLWIGILSFGMLNLRARSAVDLAKIKRGLFLAPLVFVPSYGAIFLLVTLFWYSHFEHWQLVKSPFGQITDLRLLADVVRIPYFAALLVALWGVVPRTIRDVQLADGISSESSDQPEPFIPKSAAEIFTTKRFFVLVVIAGLINAMIAGFMLCRLPELNQPEIGALFSRALIFVFVCALAGAGGSYLYWSNPRSPFRDRSPLPFSLFALICSASWLWVPAMILFQEQLSAAGAFAAMVGALGLASGLRGATRSIFAVGHNSVVATVYDKRELFEESLYIPPAELHGYAVALGLYVAGAALATRSYYTAAALLSGSAFLFAWKRNSSTGDLLDRECQYNKAILRVLRTAIPAVLVTMWALLEGAAPRNATLVASSAAAEKNQTGKKRSEMPGYGFDGYESVILWPYPEKKQIVPPIPMRDPFLAPGATRPLVIRFTGPYWFVQPPHSRPGPAAHQAHGTPIGVDIQSRNSMPLVMNAHQYLSAAIHISRCREIAVGFSNLDNRMGAISLGVLLTDGTLASKPTLYLGEQRIVSTRLEHFSIKSAPVFESLHFPVPSEGRIQKFNEVTVVILPDIEHRFEAPKIAVEQFELFPR